MDTSSSTAVRSAVAVKTLSSEELAIRAHVREAARLDATLYLAAAQVHATLALAAATADAARDDKDAADIWRRWTAVGAL